MTYVVEKSDPHSSLPGLTDETRQCVDFPDLKAAWEDLAERGPFEAHEEAGELVRGETETLQHTDPETGVEVIARRA